MADAPATGPVPVDQHLTELLDRISPLPPYDTRLMDGLGLPVAQDVLAPMSTPRFDNSSMDGYAVAFRDVAAATAEQPVHLPVVGEIAAGQARITSMEAGTAVKIMTGAPIPEGCTAVVPIEATDGGRQQVLVHEGPAEEGQYIRRAGSDVREGERLLAAGQVLGARQIGLLASVGIGEVAARQRPRVVIMSTGHELVEPGQPLRPDQIFDSNSYLLAAAAREAGAIPYRVQAAPDDPQEFTDALSDQLVRADLVVTSGGVSKGDHDVVKEALSPLGTVTFRQVAMQPGKPQGFGTVGEDDTPIFTLPGNPVSAYVSFQVFVVPAIRKLMGRTPLSRPLVRGTLTEPVILAAQAAAVPPRTLRGAVRPVAGHPRRWAELAPRRRAVGRQLPDRGQRGDRPARGRPGGARAGAGPGVLMEHPLTHLDEHGAARMVDVSGKDVTARVAVATGRVLLSAEVIGLLRGEGVPKGDALGVARLAGIMGAKRTSELIPLCHPLALSSVQVDLEVADDAVGISATVRTTDRTGVEMEALTAVSVAALTVIDMVKAVDKAAVITDVRVESKQGGKSGSWRRPEGESS